LDYKDDSDRDFDLKDFNNWALWVEKQIKIGKRWVGPGTVLIKISEGLLLFKLMDDHILRVEHNQTEVKELSNDSRIFLHEFFNSLKIQFLTFMEHVSGNLHLGVRVGGNLGFHEPDKVQQCVNSILNPYLESNYKLKGSINISGTDKYMEISRQRYYLDTYDSIIVEKNGLSAFEDVLNVEQDEMSEMLGLAIASDNRFMNRYEIDRDELVNKFSNHKLYSFLYNECFGKDRRLINSLWDSLYNPETTDRRIDQKTEEFLMYTGIVDLLPRNKLELAAKMRFFMMDNTELMDLKTKLMDGENIYETLAKMSLGEAEETLGLMKLDEIQPYSIFQSFNFKLDPNTYEPAINRELVECFLQPICEALEAGCEILNLNHLLNNDGFSAGLLTINDTKNIYMKLHGETTISTSHSKIYWNLPAASARLLTTACIIQTVFSSPSALNRFSVALKQTPAAIFPRHPSLFREWVILVTQLYLYLLNWNKNLWYDKTNKNITSQKLMKTFQTNKILNVMTSGTIRKTNTEKKVKYEFDVDYLLPGEGRDHMPCYCWGRYKYHSSEDNDWLIKSLNTMEDYVSHLCPVSEKNLEYTRTLHEAEGYETVKFPRSLVSCDLAGDGNVPTTRKFNLEVVVCLTPKELYDSFSMAADNKHQRMIWSTCLCSLKLFDIYVGKAANIGINYDSSGFLYVPKDYQIPSLVWKNLGFQKQDYANLSDKTMDNWYYITHKANGETEIIDKIKDLYTEFKLRDLTAVRAENNRIKTVLNKFDYKIYEAAKTELSSLDYNKAETYMRNDVLDKIFKPVLNESERRELKSLMYGKNKPRQAVAVIRKYMKNRQVPGDPMEKAMADILCQLSGKTNPSETLEELLKTFSLSEHKRVDRYLKEKLTPEQFRNKYISLTNRREEFFQLESIFGIQNWQDVLSGRCKVSDNTKTLYIENLENYREAAARTNSVDRIAFIDLLIDVLEGCPGGGETSGSGGQLLDKIANEIAKFRSMNSRTDRVRVVPGVQKNVTYRRT